jgi:hypothetical protein
VVGLILLIGIALLWPFFPERAGGERRTYGRDEFQTLVMGHTKEQLLKILGRPDRSQKFPDHWWFKRITVNPQGGKLDPITTVWFTENRVAAVEFGVRESAE